MPLYTVSHHTHLSSSQQDELAASITTIHTTLFTTPFLFVNVRFEHLDLHSYFVAGKRRTPNTITAHVRDNDSRPRSSYDSLCKQLHAAWESIVEHEKLDTIIILGDIVAGSEQGFMLPEAGKDTEWIAQHMAEFERRADEGDDDMADLVDEIWKRKLIPGIKKA